MSFAQRFALIIELRNARRRAVGQRRLALAALLALGACRSREAGAGPAGAALEGAREPGATLVSRRAELRPGLPAAAAAPDAGAPPVLQVSELETAPPPDACPPTMVFVAGGEFWAGASRGPRDARPRHLTRLPDFCIDRYEVTSASYAECVARGTCSAPRGQQSRCNHGRREDHPANCVDWSQAQAYCRSQGARLPSELEWEYAARGGQSQFDYSWGNAPPDHRTCWKAQQSCPVGSFPPGAFGLHDMSGNVWEWTQDWFGEYPWPKRDGRAKVFRGGGWSQRSDALLLATLRNRTQPGRWAAHIGFRCARLAREASCPFGPGEQPGTCRHGVLDAECDQPAQVFNGQRCAPAGARLCALGKDLLAGHGCVRPPRERTPGLESEGTPQHAAPPREDPGTNDG